MKSPCYHSLQFPIVIIWIVFFGTNTACNSQMLISGYNHVALEVKDIQASEVFYRDIIGLTTDIPYHRQQRFDKAWQIYITDPDGYVIELNEPKREQ